MASEQPHKKDDLDGSAGLGVVVLVLSSYLDSGKAS